MIHAVSLLQRPKLRNYAVRRKVDLPEEMNQRGIFSVLIHHCKHTDDMHIHLPQV